MLNFEAELEFIIDGGTEHLEENTLKVQSTFASIDETPICLWNLEALFSTLGRTWIYE